MPKQIALLRGINVGGRTLVPMACLRQMLEKLDLKDVTTVLQSGNVVFQAEKRTGSVLERILETETEKRLKTTVSYFVRTAAEWDRIVKRNPYPKEA